MSFRKLFLSHILDKDTPTYGNRNYFGIEKKSSIDQGDVANDSFMSTTVHIGTHIDMPYHFYQKGQTINAYDASFWYFQKPLLVEVTPRSLVIKDELIELLESKMVDPGTDLLIVKTGIEGERGNEMFWNKNPGFSPELYDYLVMKFPKLRVLGFDSISVSSFSERMIGREAHLKFLNPDHPILLLEDMHLSELSEKIEIHDVIISPLRIADSDGLPCTVFATVKDI